MPDYFAFESRMRAPTAEVRERQRPYVELLAGCGPVLDLGCGRGELLVLLREAGIAARGVDADGDMVAFARGEGVEVEQADALAALEGVEDGTLGAVTALQLVEHLPPAVLVRLLELAASKLRPGGVLAARDDQPGVAAGASQLLRRSDARAAARRGDARAARAREPGFPRSRCGS